MKHEMTAREFIHQLKRMCENMSRCGQCRFNGLSKGFENCYPPCWGEDDITALEQWAAEHPEKKRKTYAEDFFEKFPKATKVNGAPALCRDAVYDIEGNCKANESCAACWLEEMEDENEPDPEKPEATPWIMVTVPRGGQK